MTQWIGLKELITEEKTENNANNQTMADIKTALEVGSSKELGRYFDKTVKLNLRDENGAFSASQAQILLRNFFEKYQAKGFEYIHQGAIKDGNRYLIGKYEYNKGVFRVYIQLKGKSEEATIHSILFSDY